MSDRCERCGKPHDSHPSFDVSNMERFYICEDRAKKWVPVEPGHVIPAGQPYRIEFVDKHLIAAREHRGDTVPWVFTHRVGGSEASVFVDSSWRPPLELPTEPTWGIVILDIQRGERVGQWWSDGTVIRRRETFGTWEIAGVLDFIPLTPEQVARIEGAR